MIIKIILLFAVLAAATLTLSGRNNAYQLITKRAGVVVLLAAGGLAILWPDSVTRLAHLVGVGRGTDLLVYVVSVAFVLAFLGLYRRIYELERKLVVLNRRLGIAEALRDAESDPESEVGRRTS